jgi:hypothetical protein
MKIRSRTARTLTRSGNGPGLLHHRPVSRRICVGLAGLLVALAVAGCSGSSATGSSIAVATPTGSPITSSQVPSIKTPLVVADSPESTDSTVPSVEPSPTATPTPQATPTPLTVEDTIKQGDALLKTSEGRAITFDSLATDITAFYAANPGMESVYSQTFMLSLAAKFGNAQMDKQQRLIEAIGIEKELWSGVDANIDTTDLLTKTYVLGMKTFGSGFADNFRAGAPQ